MFKGWTPAWIRLSPNTIIILYARSGGNDSVERLLTLMALQHDSRANQEGNRLPSRLIARALLYPVAPLFIR